MGFAAMVIGFYFIRFIAVVFFNVKDEGSLVEVWSKRLSNKDDNNGQ